jgi:hypothetical protein
MDLPLTIEGWTFEIVEQLVDQGYLETDFYDFKAELNSKEPKHLQRLTTTACAFANTKGGFIIFGVKDLAGGNRAGRIEGIASESDLAKDFGDKIRKASPKILFEFSNPPIKIRNSSKVLFVVQIPISANRPHANGEGAFYYRTNEGNEMMSYEQIRDGFLRYEERRSKMKLLLVELVTLEGDAKATISPPGRYSLATLDTTVINSILPDVYSMIQDDIMLVKDLIQIRRMVSIMNSKIRELAGIVSHPDAFGFGPLVEIHNKDMESRNDVLLPAIERVVQKIETRYNLKRPF